MNSNKFLTHQDYILDILIELRDYDEKKFRKLVIQT
jgi:hypothetical protein